jgi:aminoglycoside phosphotransferase (APT) family kinase protein
MTQQNDVPSSDTVRAVLNVVAPNYSGFSIQPLAGSYSNHTHLARIEFGDHPAQQIVLRRYNEANGHCTTKARREFQALKYLHGQEFPAPAPLYLDESGELLGSPGIITEFVHGRQIEAASETALWGDKVELVAQMLARIHAIPYDETMSQWLMNGNVEAVWFLKSGAVPDYMEKYPHGARVWKTIAALLPQIRVVKPAFLHTDFWSGNILWHQGQISAVVDWEEAAYGDPGIDVAYCRMELYLEGLDDAADRFLNIYEAEAGEQVANLGLWELAAVARPMVNLDDWLTRPLMDERFERFIVNATQRALA